MRDPKAIRKAIMTAKSIAAMVDPHFARVPLPDIGQPAPDMLMPEPEPQQFATGGGVDDHVVNNPMSVFPKPQRMFDEDMPGGAYLSMPDKADVTGHKAAQASIGIGEGGKPYFHASRDEVDETGTPGKGSALVKTNLFKQKAGWRWLDAPEGHEGTGTIVSVEHRGNHHYVLDAHFPNGVELSRYPDAPSEPRLRPTTRGSVELGPQVGSILVRGREHPVHSHAIVREYGGRVGYADGGMPDDDRQANLDAFLEGNHPLVPSVVYHGTDRNISEFDTEKPRRVDAGMDAEKTDTGWYGKGHYFTPYKDAASHFASGYRVGEGGGPNVMPVHLSLKNPFIVKFPRSSSGGEAMDAAMNAAGFPQTSDERLIRKGKGERLPSEQTKMLMDAGHDGVIVMHQYGIKDPEEERAAEERERAAWERHQAAKNAFYEAPFENASNGAEVKALKDEFVNSRREYHAAKEAAGGEYHPHELVVFRPHQVKSAIGNSGRYDPNEAHIGRAAGGEVDQPTDYTAPDNLGLYSHAAATAASLPQAKASPAEFRSMLANKGVKKAEFEASGYDQAFAPVAGANRVEPITREQVAAHFNQNRTPIVEKSFREEPPKEEEDAFNATYAQPYFAARDRVMQALEEGRKAGINPHVNPTEEFNGMIRDYEEKGYAFRTNRGLLSNKYKRPHHESYMLPGGENYREVLLKHGGDDILFGGVGAHFEGEPNILTHLLMKDRTDTEGKSVLHLDEIQSDWGQQGRERGFYGPIDEDRYQRLKYSNERTPEEDAELAGMNKKLNGVSAAPYIKNTDDWVNLGLKRALTEAAKGGHDKLAWTPGQAVADRYKLSTYIEAIHHEKNEDGTYNLHAIDHNGYRAYAENDVPEEKLEETFGKEIASKVASGEGVNRKELQAKVDVAKKEFTEFKDKVLEADLDRRLAGRREFDPNYNWTEEYRQEIKDILKEGMERDSYTTAHNLGFGDEHEALRNNLMDAHLAYDKVPNAPGRDWRSLSGLDLQVGGEGMRKFYDDIVPKRLMALAKKHDPEAKFSTSTVKHPVSQHDYDKGDTRTDLHALEITPRMRESILKKGFPAYASGGEVEGYAGGGVVDPDKVRKALERVYNPLSTNPEHVKRALEIAQSYKTPLGGETGVGSFYRIKQSMPVSAVKSTVGDIPGVNLKPINKGSWEDFYNRAKGGLMVNVGGDLSGFGRLTHINGKELAWPVDLHAGADYMREPNPGRVWANIQGHATAFGNKIRAAEEAGREVFGVLSPMGPVAVDSSHNMFDALMAQIPGANIDPKDMEAFDDAVKRGEHLESKDRNNPKIMDALEQWPGIASAKETSDFARPSSKKITGANRSSIVKFMGQDRWQKKGFPEVGVTRVAITNPDLTGVGGNKLGYRVAKLSSKPVVDAGRVFEHSTYPVDTFGEYFQDVPLVERQDATPDVTDEIITTPYKGDIVAHPYSSDDTGRSTYRQLFEQQKQMQPINQRMLDSIMSAEERKQQLGFKKGGKIRSALMIAKGLKKS